MGNPTAQFSACLWVKQDKRRTNTAQPARLGCPYHIIFYSQRSFWHKEWHILFLPLIDQRRFVFGATASSGPGLPHSRGF